MIAATVVAALLPMSARAAQPKKDQARFTASFYGEKGSGEPVTTGEAGQFIEEAPMLSQPRPGSPAPQAEAQAARPEGEAQAAAPEDRPEAAVLIAPPIASGRVGGFIMVDPATARRREQDRIHDAVAQPRPTPPGANAYSLWSSVGKPVKVTSAKIDGGDIEQAAPAAESEFERRILGADKTYHAQPAPQQQPPAAAPPEASAAGQLFVAVNLKLRPQEELKDAVASFSQLTGFVPDPRFATASGTLASSEASLRGWLPTDHLTQAIQAPGVTRIEVDHGGPRPLGADGARSSLVIGLRVPPDGDAAAAFQKTLEGLQQSADLRWTRTIGFQTLPGSSDVALVIVGEVPVTRIPRLLADPAVLKIAPAPAPSLQTPPAPKPADAWPGFLTYARRRAPLLLTFTALFLLPQVGELAMRLLRAFIPYGRR